MELVPIQSCRSNEGWQPVQIASESDKGKHYVVLVNPWGRGYMENICECPGYVYRGYCKHQGAAESGICRWIETDDGPTAVHQPNHLRERMVCPRCGGPTRWEIEVVEDNE